MLYGVAQDTEGNRMNAMLLTTGWDSNTWVSLSMLYKSQTLHGTAYGDKGNNTGGEWIYDNNGDTVVGFGFLMLTPD